MRKNYLTPEINVISLIKDDIMSLSATVGDIGDDGHISWNYDENGGF